MKTYLELAVKINELGGELGVTQKIFYIPTGYVSYTTDIIVFNANFVVKYRNTYLTHETEQQIVEDMVQQEVLKKIR